MSLSKKIGLAFACFVCGMSISALYYMDGRNLVIAFAVTVGSAVVIVRMLSGVEL